VNPPHVIRTGLGARDLQRSVCRVQADHLDAPLGEKQRERPGAAPHIHYAMRSQLTSDVGIRVQITSVWIQRVVDRRQSRMLKDRIGHASQRKRQRGRTDRPPRVWASISHAITCARCCAILTASASITLFSLQGDGPGIMSRRGFPSKCHPDVGRIARPAAVANVCGFAYERGGSDGLEGRRNRAVTTLEVPPVYAGPIRLERLLGLTGRA
jgi:hypothetical protein